MAAKRSNVMFVLTVLFTLLVIAVHCSNDSRCNDEARRPLENLDRQVEEEREKCATYNHGACRQHLRDYETAKLDRRRREKVGTKTFSQASRDLMACCTPLRQVQTRRNAELRRYKQRCEIST